MAVWRAKRDYLQLPLSSRWRLLTSSLTFNLNLTLNVPKVWKFHSFNVFMLRHWRRHFLLVFSGFSGFVSRGILDLPFSWPHFIHPSVIPFFGKYSSYFPFLKSFDRVISHVSFFCRTLYESLWGIYERQLFWVENEGSSHCKRTGDLITITSSTTALALLLTLFLIVLLSTKRTPLTTFTWGDLPFPLLERVILWQPPKKAS